MERETTNCNILYTHLYTCSKRSIAPLAFITRANDLAPCIAAQRNDTVASHYNVVYRTFHLGQNSRSAVQLRELHRDQGERAACRITAERCIARDVCCLIVLDLRGTAVTWIVVSKARVAGERLYAWVCKRQTHTHTSVHWWWIFIYVFFVCAVRDRYTRVTWERSAIFIKLLACIYIGWLVALCLCTILWRNKCTSNR